MRQLRKRSCYKEVSEIFKDMTNEEMSAIIEKGGINNAILHLRCQVQRNPSRI